MLRLPHLSVSRHGLGIWAEAGDGYSFALECGLALTDRRWERPEALDHVTSKPIHTIMGSVPPPGTTSRSTPAMLRTPIMCTSNLQLHCNIALFLCTDYVISCVVGVSGMNVMNEAMCAI